MKEREHKIVLFPKEKERLEKQAFQSFHNHQYKEALTFLNELIDYGVEDIDVIVAKVTCLIELGRQIEAEYLLEDQIDQQTKDYYSYINIYATVLFQAHKHKRVDELLAEALTEAKLENPMRSQLEKLYEVNQPLVSEEVDKETSITKRELVSALESKDVNAQWHLINHLQGQPITPYISLFEHMLADASVHPVIKTVVLNLLQANQFEQVVSIEKFGHFKEIKPKRYPYMNDHPIKKQLLSELSDIEQKDPTFFRMVNQLIDRYFYVHYPMVEHLEDIALVKAALLALVEGSFKETIDVSGERKADIEVTINRFIEAEQLYFSVIEE
ncbi:hypothetical protein DES38_10862 [Streptohalobacillus salinus]|uniref:Tetratricopeptide repeat protein n=1 Tax=Streptohalobacillus salinus TaxID=621096 RepID=A0A2V3W7N9_9BACI|nr:hypothetical protein [Streptohalobacillus salinus]PXW90050.1 hypothetical protein DES38_10862 [Streptohalobacillus salinus]